MINNLNIYELRKNYILSYPFNHIVIDDFFKQDIALKIAQEFPSWDHDSWEVFYNSPLEVKKSQNSWNKFANNTYQAFQFLCLEFTEALRTLTGNNLHADLGLHGGGLHSHSTGGKLNVHLDYELHPKLELQRKLNLIVYLNPTWETSWGGQLELWSGNDHMPSICIHKINPVFNRAVIFDTTQNSWHGLPEPITCPEHVSRNSLAVYYVQQCKTHKTRTRARFVLSDSQKGDQQLEELCERRSRP